MDTNTLGTEHRPYLHMNALVNICDKSISISSPEKSPDQCNTINFCVDFFFFLLQNLKMPMGIYIIVLIFVFGIVIILNSSIIYERNQLPCEYLDSINITDGIHRPDDDSVVFNGMVFDKNQYARIDYVLDNGMTHRAVPSYVRGCICQMKSCIRLCCPYNSFYQNRSCHRHSNHTHIQRLKTTILNRHKQIELISLDHRFTYVTDRSCHQRYIADEYQMIYVRNLLYESIERQKQKKI